MSDDTVVAFPTPDPAKPEPTHIRLTLPLGCFVHSAGQFHVVQYLIDPGRIMVEGEELQGDLPQGSYGLALFDRFTGEQMSPEDVELMCQAPTPAEEAPHLRLLGKDGRPLSGVQGAPEGSDKAFALAKPGASMLTLLRDHQSFKQ